MLVYAREDPTVEPRIGPRLHALVPAAPFGWIDRSSHFAHGCHAEFVALLRELGDAVAGAEEAERIYH